MALDEPGTYIFVHGLHELVHLLVEFLSSYFHLLPRVLFLYCFGYVFGSTCTSACISHGFRPSEVEGVVSDLPSGLLCPSMLISIPSIQGHPRSLFVSGEIDCRGNPEWTTLRIDTCVPLAFPRPLLVP